MTERWTSNEGQLTQVFSTVKRSSPHQFIIENGLSRPRGSPRQVIRSQVMLNTVQKRPRKSKVIDAKSRDFGLARRRSSFIHSEGGSSLSTEHILKLEDKDQSFPPDDPGRQAGDPFGSLPLKTKEKALFFLGYYHSVVTKSRMAVSPQRAWLPFAIHSSAVLHTTLASAALHILLSKYQPDVQAAYLKHKIEGIRAINLSISDSSEVKLDSTISAVAVLTFTEAVCGNTSACRAHMDGLEWLVQHRGGLESFSESRLVQRFVAWVDLSAAICLRAHPRFPSMIPSSEDRITLSKEDRIRGEAFKLFLLQTTGSLSLTEQAVNIYRRLSEMSSCIQAVHAVDSSDKIESVERRVICLVQDSTQVEDESRSSIFLAFGLSSLIYIYCIIRQFPANLPLLLDLSNRLDCVLEHTDLTVLEDGFPSLLLWMVETASRTKSDPPGASPLAEKFSGEPNES